MKKTKQYDAVAAVRKTRRKLSKQYWNNPVLFKQDLKAESEKFYSYFKPVNA